MRPSRVVRDYHKRKLVGMWLLGLGLLVVITLGLWWAFKMAAHHEREQAAYERANECHPTDTTKTVMIPHKVGNVQTFIQNKRRLWRCEKNGQEYWK